MLRSFAALAAAALVGALVGAGSAGAPVHASAASCPAAADVPRSAFMLYEVRHGETLRRIVVHVYGASGCLPALEAANPGIGPQMPLHPGTSVRIPYRLP